MAEAPSLPTPKWATLEEAPVWFRSFMQQAQRVDSTVWANVNFEYEGVELRAQEGPIRLAPSEIVDQTLLVSASGERVGPFFDVGEWFTVLDGISPQVRGEDQLAILDRLDEVRSAQEAGVLPQLRAVRDAWVEAEGNKALHDDSPVWPSGLVCPAWMTELDELLVAEGFGSGWLVGVGPEYLVGVVRQRGPLRVQLSVYGGEVLVQFAVWPHCSWRPLDTAAMLVGATDDDPEVVGAAGVLEIGEQFCDTVFSGESWPGNLKFRTEAAQARGPVGLVSGPLFGHDFYRLGIGMPFANEWMDWEADAQTAASLVKGRPETALGGSFHSVELRAKGRDVSKIPSFMQMFGHFVDTEMRGVVERFAPDASFFEFDLGGRPFFEVLLPRSSWCSVTDVVRSRFTTIGVIDLGRVVDPRQLGRPGHLVKDGLDWICDDGFRGVAEPVSGVEFEVTWDGERQAAFLEERDRLA